MSDQTHKPHRKAKEKKQRAAGSENPKANTFANPGRFAKQAARSHDVKEKRFHVPLIDRIPEEAPPLIVAVVGPPQVGKTTLIKSLLKRYTKQTVSDPKGPLTVVTSKRRRLTFIECPADSLASMIDIAKVVDIVLLMIDGKYGFEMETMEFLNILSSSGMPGNVFGILTKLDLFKKQDTLRAQKKRLKHRFWSELYQGAKLFYLSGIINGRYPDREIHNLTRFLSVMKNPRPLVWRNSHPYCLADRFLDITDPVSMEQNIKCDRKIALYGYLRGTNFPAENARVHVPGVGDLNVSEIEALPDPCPTPFMDQAIAQKTGKTARRRLGDKQKVLFAPMSDVGGVLVDKDAVYIDVKTNSFDREALVEDGYGGLGERMVMGLQGDQRLLGHGDRSMRLFGNSTLRRPADGNAEEEVDEAYVSGGSDIDSEDDHAGVLLDDHSSDEDSTLEEQAAAGRRIQFDRDDEEIEGDIAFADSDSDIGSLAEADHEDLNDSEPNDHSPSEDAEDGAMRWRERLDQKAQDLLAKPLGNRATDLYRLMYDLTVTPKEAMNKWHADHGSLYEDNSYDSKDDEADDFFVAKDDGLDGVDGEDRMVPVIDYSTLEAKWTDEGNLTKLRGRFTSSRRAGTRGEDDEELNEEDFGEDDDDMLTGEDEGEDDEGDGAFEDLETGEVKAVQKAESAQTLEEERERNAKRKEELKLRFEEEDRDGFANDKASNRRQAAENMNHDFKEDEWYDAQKAKIQKQLDINRAEYDEMDAVSRIRAEGFRAGTYARIVLEKVPCEFAQNFSPRLPIIIGGLSPTEDRFGYVQVRIKRHRWHNKILKTNDPLVFSLGWRRFQSIPIYSISDSRTRNRMLKYTPEHMHCFGTFWGPLIAPNTGFSCVQSFSNKSRGFRVAATGVVLSVDESTEIVKKVKLKGHPHKIYKNTAIIRDMFASELEVMKFKSGNLRTVSGIRGMIKGRAGNKYPDGYVRAGFEDKILMSDIVFLSAWRSVRPREFYMPVTNLLDAHAPSSSSEEDAERAWKGMRLTGEVRAEQGVPVPQIKDSLYRAIERPERHFNPLRVPRKLEAELPFKSQIVRMKPQRNETYMQKRAVVLGGEEKKARDLMQKLTTIRNEKVAKRKAAQEKRKEPYRKAMAENLEKKAAREKRERDEYWKREGRKRKNADSGAGGGKRQRI